MTDKELQKLKRTELLELMIAQSKQIIMLKKQLEQAELKLQEREILLQESGNIAEAALRLNHIFEDAQQAADDYLASIRKVHEEDETMGEEGYKEDE